MGSGQVIVRPAPGRPRRPLVALLTADLISGFGNEMTWIAIPWFVLQTTGSASKTGVAAFAHLLPFVVSMFLGGVLVDRVGFKRMSIIADLASGTAVALIPLLHVTIGLEFWVLIGLIFLGAVLDAPGITARRSLLPDLSDHGGVHLGRANAVFEGALQAKNLLGPLAAGVLIVAFGASNVLWFDAATFAISALLVWIGIPSTASGVRAPAATGMRQIVADMMVGLRFIRRERVILWMSLTSLIANFLFAPLFLVILPVYVNERLGSAADLGIVVAAFGGTALFGSAVYGMFGDRVPRRVWYFGTQLTQALGMCYLATMPDLYGAVAAVGLMGLASGALRPFASTIRQERTPVHLRGRVFGPLGALINAATPIGMPAAGLLIASVGLSQTLLIFATVSILLPIWVILNPVFQQLSPHALESAATNASA